MKKASLALALLLATPGLALAEGVDADSDGLLTWEEVMTAYPDVTEEQFAQADLDGNGSLDEAEVAAAREAGLLPAEEM